MTVAGKPDGNAALTANGHANAWMRTSTKRAAVLVVDDEPYVTRGIQSALFRSPFEILAANSAKDALALLRERKIDVVVSDECMPGMTGIEFLARVRSDFPAIVRIVLTGQATLDLAARAINEGKIAAFLQKPCPPERLLEAIIEALPRTATGVTFSNEVISRGFPREDFERLSVREKEILCFVVDGQRLSQIAKRLFISEHTARNHLKAIFRKLDIHSQSDLIRRGRDGLGAAK